MPTNKLDLGDLDRLVAEHYVREERHPRADLWIYNYTEKATYNRYWTPLTMACRGLILDADRTVVARPFPKFFNLGEHQTDLPAEPFEVFEKLDGSLGIMYWLEGEPYISTRGSFVSQQAQIANALLRERYAGCAWDRRLTYLFEIIAPETRLVVNYGDRRELVLLAAIETATGREWPLRDAAVKGIGLVPSYGLSTDPWALLDKERDRENAEGYVIWFPSSGLRLKVKFQEYVRLHRLITGVTQRRIWEALKDGMGLEEMLDRVPADYATWVQQQAEELLTQYRSLMDRAEAAFREVSAATGTADRRAFALHAQREFGPYQHLMYAMLDGKPADELIWKMIRPAATRAFKQEI